MNRREFMAGLGGMALIRATSPSLKLGVINDEITQDLDHALAVARELGCNLSSCARCGTRTSWT